MNPAKCDSVDYIQFLVAAQRRFTCSEPARCQPESPQAPAHDAFTRLLRRQPPDTGALWQETQGAAKKPPPTAGHTPHARIAARKTATNTVPR